MSCRRIKVFFDGGCRPNPGPIEVAAVVRGSGHFRGDLGCGTNHDAEWLALLNAIEVARSLGVGDQIDLLGDSLPVVREAQAVLKGARVTNPHAARLQALAADSPVMRVRWIKREQNLAGILLASRHPR